MLIHIHQVMQDPHSIYYLHHLLYDFFRSVLLPLLHSKLLLDFFCSFYHHFALQTKFGVVLGKLTIRYSGVDGHPNDDHSESVPGCWHGIFFKTIVLLRYVNSSCTFLVNFKAGPPLDWSFWSFLTFLHHGIEEVERHLL